MKYLIVICEQLSDQFECDANRIPWKIVDDWTKVDTDEEFEIYEIQENGELKLLPW